MKNRTHNKFHSLVALVLCAVMLLGMIPGGLAMDAHAAGCTHEHTDECYTQELTCGKDEHTHTEECYVQSLSCETEEHAHSEECYDENGVLVCGKEEHSHTDICSTSTLICGLEEHTHSADCYTMTLNCPHVCDVSCFAVENSAKASAAITLKNFKITEWRSGTWDQDKNDYAGNDSNTANNRVLSLDNIVYITSYSVETASGYGTATGGTYYFEAVLPCSSDIATWNTSGMSWLDHPTVTTNEKGHQILSGGLNLENAQSAPRVGSLEWLIHVNSTTNAEKVPAPTFTMWVDAEEKPENAASVPGKDMYVSAKANYNAQIKYEGQEGSGNRKWSLALQLKSSALEKGMLGTSIPNGTLAFDVELDQNQQLVGYKLNNQTDTGTNIPAADYGKLAPFDDGSATQEQNFNTVYDGGTVTMKQKGTRVQVKFTGITVPEQFYADYVTHNAGKTNKYQGVDYNEDTYNFAAAYFTCTNAATPSAGQTVTATATISDSTISGLNKGEALTDTYESDNTASYIYTTPVLSPPGGSTGPWQGNCVGKVDVNSGDVGQYSDDGQIQLNIGDRFRYKIETSYAQAYGNGFGTESLGLPVSDRAFVKFSGKAFEVVDDSSYTEYSISSVCLYNPGTGYVNAEDEKKVTESNVRLKYVTLKTGSDWKSEEVMLNTRYSTSQFNVYHSVAALKRSGEVCVGFLLDTTYPSYTYDNAYHETAYELPVLQVRDTAILDSDGEFLDSSRVNDRVYAQVVDLTDIKIRPTKGASAIGSIDYDADRLSSTFLDNPGAGYTDENGSGIFQVNVTGPYGLANRLIGYRKTIYKTNAQETVLAEHQGNERIHNSVAGSLSGSSIKINTYTTYVNKQIAQRTDDDAELNAFMVDRGQRRADFLINAGTNCDADVQVTDTLTITDTIPADLYPLDSTITGTTAAAIERRWGIAYGGIAMQDPTTNGGVGVTWENENTTNTVSSKMNGTGQWKKMVADTKNWLSVPYIYYTLSETANEDGTTTLVWKIKNMPLGYAVPTIHYGTQIGTPENGITDVKNGDALINKVSIQSAVLPTVNTDESRVSVYKVSGGIISKKADKETLTSIEDPIGYTIEFSNNSTETGQSERDDMYVADVFPYSGDSNNSSDPGDYVLEKVSLSGRIKQKNSSSDLKLYYSTAPGAQVDAFLKGYLSYRTIDFPTSIWETPVTMEVDPVTGRIDDTNIKTALEGKKVTAIVFVGTGIARNSTFAVHYGLAYNSEAAKAEAIADMHLSNTATLQVGGNVDQQAASTATIIGGVPFQFTKVDGSGNPLKGAEFKLYKLICTDTSHNHDANVSDSIRDGCYTAMQENGEDKIFGSSENGIVDFDLLQNGTYILAEVKAPTGCELPTGQWKLVIDGSAVNRVTITAIGTVPAFYRGAQGAYYLPNYPKTVLPSSGGMGTILFTAGGVILIGAAILILVLTSKKRRKPKDEMNNQRY
ncbi:MAG: SpaA isopeptide-forming pilin-related protein [Lachnospiraceae bacterium]|nr:SpaA isopeptide-forming pilin-related protein [Lachnospiraceae bacterium]